MITSINGTVRAWTPAIWAKWHTFADTADPKLTRGTVVRANYFTPRPAIDQYNRGSCTEGFVYTIQPAHAAGVPQVWSVIISRHAEIDLRAACDAP